MALAINLEIYASSQVGRYKVTGLVRAIDQIPENGPGFDPVWNDRERFMD